MPIILATVLIINMVLFVAKLKNDTATSRIIDQQRAEIIPSA